MRRYKGICAHGRQRYDCKECGGGSLCEHGRKRGRCSECTSKVAMAPDSATATAAPLQPTGAAASSSDAAVGALATPGSEVNAVVVPPQAQPTGAAASTSASAAVTAVAPDDEIVALEVLAESDDSWDDAEVVWAQ